MHIEIVQTTNDKAEMILKAIRGNGGYCLTKERSIPENKCMCKEFTDMPVGSWCRCGLYYKNLTND